MPHTDQKLISLKNDLIRLIQSKQFKKAEKLYPRIKGREINDSELWRLFAGIHSERGNLDELAQCCKNILKINPNDFVTLYNLAAALQNKRQYSEAIKQYENCMAINPDYYQAYINCAYIYDTSGDSEKAFAYYEKALERHDDTKTRILYGEALMKAGNYSRAIKEFISILTREPTNGKSLFLTAQSYYESLDYHNSEIFYLKLLESIPDNLQAINNLGRLYEEVGRIEESIDMFRKAEDIDNSTALIQRNLARILARAGKLDEAIVKYQKSIELDPEHPDAYFNLGKIYIEKNDPEHAKACFEKALDTDFEKLAGNPDGLLTDINYFLSTIDNPEEFGDEKKVFVADLFDKYADRFDDHLVKKLQYKTPEIINGMLKHHIKNNDNNTMDLGCGTGLCCKYLRSFSNKIVGVDLSPKMIDKAEKLGCYDKLIVGEITETMKSSNEVYDLIIAADVFVYIGCLNEIFKVCSEKLNTDGYFIFSIELLDDHDNNKDYKQYISGRYKHSIKYIDAIANENHLNVIEHKKCALRKENEFDVIGIATVLKKSASDIFKEL